MENEKILQELQEIKELLKQLLEETKWVNNNIETATHEITRSVRIFGN